MNALAATTTQPLRFRAKATQADDALEIDPRFAALDALDRPMTWTSQDIAIKAATAFFYAQINSRLMAEIAAAEQRASSLRGWIDVITAAPSYYYAAATVSPQELFRHLTPPARQKIGSPTDEWDQCLKDLSEMALEGTPDINIVRHIEAMLPVMRPNVRLPEFDVDEGGTVALRWDRDGDAFALHFNRTSIVAVFVSASGQGFSEKLDAGELGVLRTLERPDVAAVTK